MTTQHPWFRLTYVHDGILYEETVTHVPGEGFYNEGNSAPVASGLCSISGNFIGDEVLEAEKARMIAELGLER